MGFEGFGVAVVPCHLALRFPTSKHRAGLRSSLALIAGLRISSMRNGRFHSRGAKPSAPHRPENSATAAAVLLDTRRIARPLSRMRTATYQVQCHLRRTTAVACPVSKDHRSVTSIP
jgi:hypothetical protein